MTAFFNHVLLRMLKLDSASSKAAQITERQHKALVFIKGAPASDEDGWVPLRYVRQSLLADKATAGQLVERLRKKNLVMVRRPRENAPAHVKLTRRGEKTLADVAIRNRAALAELAAGIDPASLPTMLDFMLRYVGVEEQNE
ncbi:MAG: hypothetical protein WDA71_03555 [Actinomycetota bacterium]